MASGVQIGNGGENVTANSEDGRENKNFGRPEVIVLIEESVVNKDNAHQLNLDEPPPSLRNWLSGWISKVLRMITTHLKSSWIREDEPGKNSRRDDRLPIYGRRRLRLQSSLDGRDDRLRNYGRILGHDDICMDSQLGEWDREDVYDDGRDDRLRNYGRCPLNSDFFARVDSVRPQPSTNEGTYGGGFSTSTRHAERDSEASYRIQTGNDGQGNGTSGARGLMLIHPPDQVSPQGVNPTTKTTEKEKKKSTSLKRGIRRLNRAISGFGWP